jgi:hypothetical protein
MALDEAVENIRTLIRLRPAFFIHVTIEKRVSGTVAGDSSYALVKYDFPGLQMEPVRSSTEYAKRADDADIVNNALDDLVAWASAKELQIGAIKPADTVALNENTLVNTGKKYALSTYVRERIYQYLRMYDTRFGQAGNAIIYDKTPKN